MMLATARRPEWIKRPRCFQIKCLFLTTTKRSEKRLLTVGIAREDYNLWGRRAPLSPTHVQQLLQQHDGIHVVVQRSARRIFPNVASVLLL